jgi:hypothetical protein
VWHAQGPKFHPAPQVSKGIRQRKNQGSFLIYNLARAVSESFLCVTMKERSQGNRTDFFPKREREAEHGNHEKGNRHLKSYTETEWPPRQQQETVPSTNPSSPGKEGKPKPQLQGTIGGPGDRLAVQAAGQADSSH